MPRRCRQQRANPQLRLDARVVALEDVVVGPVRRSLWVLFAAVGLVLAAACANVANLLLARMSVRIREVVTRAALGATPRRLACQFLAESLLLALVGGAAGALVARWGTGLLTRVAPARIPRAHEVALDWQAFAFLLLVCVATAVLFGLAPALAATRVDVAEHRPGSPAAIRRSPAVTGGCATRSSCSKSRWPSCSRSARPASCAR